MAGVTHPLPRFISDYGRPLLLALLVHALLLVLLLTIKFPPAVQLPQVEPITSFLYQPPSNAPTNIKPTAEPVISDSSKALPDATTEGPPTDDVRLENPTVASPSQALAENDLEQDPSVAKPVRIVSDESLAQRAFNQARKPDADAIDRAATASYQQFLQQQQQPRLTVDKKHWPISEDPAKHVVAQLDDGRQIIRTKERCRIGDPMLDGFEALMAAKLVPCGDEVSTSALLKQALEKHSKR